MTIPTYDQFIDPILRFLASHPEGALARDAHEAAAQALGLSELDRQELLPSGNQPIYKNRAAWAHDRLKRAGLSASPRRGHWRLTDAGHTYAATHPAPLAAHDVERLAMGFIGVRLKVDHGDTPLDSADRLGHCQPRRPPG